jgi:Domain of unknown function (DUF4430)
MTLSRLAGAFAAAVLLTGCGGSSNPTGRATLWVTRDRGARVLLTHTVPAGVTALQALEQEAETETRYGGRFVESIEGLEGDLAGRRDWFYFINGIESDRGAAEYRLRPGDVEWWDYRSWESQMHEPVVVGAFPEPFLHGYDGDVRQAVVRYDGGALASGARVIAKVIRARSVAPASVRAPPEANLFLVVAGKPRFRASPRTTPYRAGAPVKFVFAGDARRLARDPTIVRYRYQGLP